MKLTFRTLVIHDFKEYVGKHVLKPVKLGLGVHFVKGVNEVDPELGSNGASKSTIFDALRWCLYGSTVKGLKNPDVKTWGGSEPACVVLHFEVDGERHVIKRSTKTNGLTLNDEIASQMTIDRLVMPAVLFDHGVLMGQGEPLFLDLSPTPKLNVLSDILDLERWDRRSGAAKVMANDAQANATKWQYQAESLVAELERAEKNMRAEKERMSAWEKERSERDTGRDKRISELNKIIEVLDRKWGKADLKYDSAETELRASRKRQQDLIEHRGQLATSEAQLLARIETLEKVFKDKPTSCPTCGQAIKNVKKLDLSEQREELAALNKDYDKVREQYDDTNDKCNLIKKEIADFTDKSNEAQDRMTRLGTERANAKAELSQLSKNAYADGERVNPHSEALADYRSTIKKLKADIADAEKAVRQSYRKAERFKEWVGYFKQIRLYLLDEALSELQAVTNEMMPTVGLEGWRIDYDIEKESKSGKVTPGLTVTILKPSMTKAVRWESWSGGEAQRLRLVASIALSRMLLRRVGIQCDTLVLDEPTQHLSAEGVRDTVSLLCDLGRESQIFYVDHQAVESSRFASVITVTKTAKGAGFHVA